MRHIKNEAHKNDIAPSGQYSKNEFNKWFRLLNLLISNLIKWNSKVKSISEGRFYIDGKKSSKWSKICKSIWSILKNWKKLFKWSSKLKSI